MHDSKTAAALLDAIMAGGIIADKAYDSNTLRQTIAASPEVIEESQYMA